MSGTISDPITEYLKQEGLLPATDPKEMTDQSKEEKPKPRQELLIVFQRPPLKGPRYIVFENRRTNGLSDVVVPMEDWNGAHIRVDVAGTTPSVNITAEGCEDPHGNYSVLPDSNATKNGVAAATRFEVACGAAFLKIRLASISGTFGEGQGYTITVTPYIQ